MTQETRRDRRVKIVSLNVRYKSATVDEFIENHAHDVSRGGIYIKTANPFPPGTLLKFEIRLASDQAVIAGVGRVVWKRDTGQSKSERPAGMGVKFIKIDDPSKAVIDRLANSRTDAGKSFESESEGTGGSEPPPRPTPAPAGEMRISTRPGMGAAHNPKATMAGLGVTALAPPTSPSEPPTRIMEPGAVKASPLPAAPLAPPRPGGSSAPMFPKAEALQEAGPKQEATVMKQAAELLEEALREAGGSMDDIGTNPLFAGGGKGPSNPPAAPRPTPSDRPSANRTKVAEEAAKARAMVAELAPASPRAESVAPQKTESAPPPKVESGAPPKVESAAPPAVTASTKPSRQHTETHSAKVVIEQDATSPGRRRLGNTARASDAPVPKKGGSAFIIGFVTLAAVAAALLLYRDKLFGGGAATEPAPGPAIAVPTEVTPAPTPIAPAPTHQEPVAPPVVASAIRTEPAPPGSAGASAPSASAANNASSAASAASNPPAKPASPPAVAKPAPSPAPEVPAKPPAAAVMTSPPRRPPHRSPSPRQSLRTTIRTRRRSRETVGPNRALLSS